MTVNIWKAAAGIGVLAINFSAAPVVHSLAERVHCLASHGTSGCNHAFSRSAGSRWDSDESIAPVANTERMTLAAWPPQDVGTAAQTQEQTKMDLQSLMAQVRNLSDDGDETGWLGVETGEVTAGRVKELKLPVERGVYVESVQSGSPAEKAGLKNGDVILNFDQQSVEGAMQFRRLVEETPAGRTVKLNVWRNGRAQDISVDIGKREDMEGNQWMSMKRGELTPLSPNPMIAPGSKFHFEFPRGFDLGTPRLGISAQDLNGQLGSYFGAPDGKGVLVVEVIAGSAAEKAGLKAGDVITQVEGKPVKSTDNLRDLISSNGNGNEVTLSILRRSAIITIHVKLPPPPPEETGAVERVSL